LGGACGYLNFFFQAEDGIRDATVTGVQTCALPILNVATVAPLPAAALMRADAMRVLVLLRPTMARFAPSAASASAAANPMPLVAPVIRICLSFTAQQSKAMANAQDDLFEVKDLALDQSQPTTSPILKNSAPSIGIRRRPS